MCDGHKINPEEELEIILDDCKMMNVYFPSDSIKDKWVKNMRSFVANFSKPKWFDRAESEVQFLYKLDNIFIQGFIDIVEFLEDGYVNILDWKTSSKFTKKDLEKYGRQLVIYGLALEQLGYKINSIAWNMLKYCTISWTLKNGKTKDKICQRGFWVEECENDIIKELKVLGYDSFDIELLMDSAKSTNDITLLPQEIQDKYTVTDYVLYYDYSEENKEECKQYIREKVKEIESNVNDELLWQPMEINYGSHFFCSNLCNHRDKCEYLKKYNEEQEELRSKYKAKDEDEIDLDDLLG